MPQPKRDAVHRHYTFDAESNTSKCNICGNKMKGKHTSNLKSHLAAKHTSAFVEVTNVNKSYKADQPTNSSNKCDNLIKTLKNLSMQLIAIHGRPLALLNDEPYQKILNIAASSARSKEINEKSVRIIIPEEAYKIKLKIAAEIRGKLISLKVDSATCAERRFLGVNIQYINDGKIVVRNLAVLEFYESQTGDFLKEKLLEIMDEFMIPKEDIYSITTDNGSNMKKMTKLLKGDFWSDDSILINEGSDIDSEAYDGDVDEEESQAVHNESEELPDIEFTILQNALSQSADPDLKIRGMLCAAHTLQLAVKDAVDENVDAQSSFDLARRIARILRTPTNRNLLNLANLKVPIIDCATRWTSKYHMLLRLQELRDFCESIDSVVRLVSSEFWDNVDELLNCLEPFYIATLELQKEQLTIGDFYISWMKCKSKIDCLHNSFACSLRKAMQERQKLLLETDVVLEGLYMDGRLNIVLSEEQCLKARALLKQTWQKTKKFGEVSQNTSVEDQEEPRPGPSTQPEPQSNLSRASKDLLAIEQMLVRTEMARGISSGSVSSFDSCLRELRQISRLPLDTNIIQHWCTKSSANSELARVANIVLATPVTQVSVERMFSSLKFLLSPLRSNLDSNLLQNMLFIRSNKDLLDKDY